MPVGRHSRFFSSVVLPVDSRKPCNAPDSVRPRRVTSWSVIVSSVKIARGGLSLRPGRRAMHVEMIGGGRDGAVLQHDLLRVDALDMAEADDVLDAAELVQLPRSTVPPFIIVGTTVRSVRNITSSASRRSYTSSTESRHGHRLELEDDAGKGPGCPGWKNARLRIQESRGRIHVMSSGSQPRSSNQQMASNAVLPPPTITYPAAGCASVVSSPTGTQRTPSATVERQRFRRRDARRHVGGVDDAAANGHVRHPLGHSRTEAPRRPGSRTSGRTGPAPTR